MRIGIISVNDKSTNLLARGGTEVFSANLSYHLAGLGHEVYLFGSADSMVDGVKIIPTTDESLWDMERVCLGNENQIKNIFQIRNVMVAKMYENQIDIFHDNMSCEIGLAMQGIFSKPIISSLHMPIDGIFSNTKLSKYIYSPQIVYAVASRFQQSNLPHGIRSEFIPNGIDVNLFQENGIKNETEDLIWIGRINPASPKGLDDAIYTANQTKKRLRYVGLIENDFFFQKNINPLMNENIIKQPHFSSNSEKVAFYRSGKVLINPIKWEEPFGLTFIEAMSTGTPIISYALGAAPEIIEDGKTGLLVNLSQEQSRGDWIIKSCGVQGLCDAVRYIYKMNESEYMSMRYTCAEQARRKYDIQKMVQRYEALYKKILCM